MKKIATISILLLGLFSATYAQDYSNLDRIPLKEKADYQKNEAQVLECSNYILSSTATENHNNINNLNALKFLIRWMSGTPDFQFDIDATIAEPSKSNPALLGVYMACMAKFVLENKDKAKDPKEVKYNSILTFIGYCEDASKMVKPNRELKKLIKAKNDNTLKEYLKL